MQWSPWYKQMRFKLKITKREEKKKRANLLLILKPQLIKKRQLKELLQLKKMELLNLNQLLIILKTNYWSLENFLMLKKNLSRWKISCMKRLSQTSTSRNHRFQSLDMRMWSLTSSHISLPKREEVLQQLRSSLELIHLKNKTIWWIQSIKQINPKTQALTEITVKWSERLQESKKIQVLLQDTHRQLWAHKLVTNDSSIAVDKTVRQEVSLDNQLLTTRQLTHLWLRNLMVSQL